MIKVTAKVSKTNKDKIENKCMLNGTAKDILGEAISVVETLINGLNEIDEELSALFISGCLVVFNRHAKEHLETAKEGESESKTSEGGIS